MSIPEPLRTRLVECVRCTVDCPGIQLDSEHGIIPRGFGFGLGTIRDKELMVIFPEPASNDYREQTRYRRAKRLGGWESVAEEVDHVTTEYFETGQSTFHKRTMGLLIGVFRSQSEVLRTCYFTELTKCQKSTSSIPPWTRQECLDRHLRRELKIIQPKAALLFGAVKNYQDEIDSILKVEGRAILAQHPRARPPDWLYEDSPERERITEEVRRLLNLI